MKSCDTAVYRFGGFLLVPRERVLLHQGEPVALAGKAFDLLVMLVSQAGCLATKDELLQSVWPGLVVEEVNLSVNMSAIRKALACSPDAADWIETVPRQGYRFRAPVEVDDIATLNASRVSPATAPEALDAPSFPAAKRIRPKSAWLAYGALALALAVGSDGLRSAEQRRTRPWRCCLSRPIRRSTLTSPMASQKKRSMR